MAIGEKIAELRSQRDLSQREIHRETGLSSGYLSRMEHGEQIPRDETIEQLSEILGVDEEVLLEERDLTLFERNLDSALAQLGHADRTAISELLERRLDALREQTNGEHNGQ